MRILILCFLFLSIHYTSFSQYNDSLSPPPIIPYWAFGHWVWEDEFNTDSAVYKLVGGYLNHDIPVNAIIIDSPWMRQYNDFTWDKSRYHNPQLLIDSLNASGIRTLAFYTGCLNSSSYSGSKEKCVTYDYAVSNNFCVNGNNESKWFKGPGVHIDMTKSAARDWWHNQIGELHKMKLNGAKIDFGFAWFGDTIETSIGNVSKREFAYHYYGDAFDYHTSQDPEFVSMTYAWSGLGLMGFPSKSHVNWVGDFTGDWNGINKQLKNIYLSANYGFSGIGCEIGGYWKTPSNKTEFIRYAQMASLCPIMINGGSLGAFEHHIPWYHDSETVDIYREFVNLHQSLAPYLFSASVDANLNHSTIIRNANYAEKSHFLGDQLFVKVITDSLETTAVNLPGTSNWIDWFDLHQYNAKETVEKQYNLASYPLFVREGTILPILEDTIVTFYIFPGNDFGYTFHQPTNNGIDYSDIQFSYSQEKHMLEVKSEQQIEFHFKIFQPKITEHRHKDGDISNWHYITKKGSNFSIKI